MGARETLRVTEQQVLLDAATAYMNLLRDAAILELNRRNVEVLTCTISKSAMRGSAYGTPTADNQQAAIFLPSEFARARIAACVRLSS
jgi:outer membrane protein